MDIEASPGSVPPSTANALPDFDRARLNELKSTANAPGVYFGKGFELTPDDRVELARVAGAVDEVMRPYHETAEWEALQGLITEGSTKGVLQGFATHPDTLIPTLIVDGGAEAKVGKVLCPGTDGTSAPGIEVPTGLYWAYHWTTSADRLRDYAGRSDEVLRGTSPKPLAKILGQTPVLFPQPDDSGNQV